MEELIKDFECHLTLMADDLHDIVSHSNSIVQYIKEHESEWSRSGTGNNVQITPIGNEGRRIAKYKIDNNPEGYIYAPTTPGLNGDTTIIIPKFGTGTPIADYVASNGSGTIYAPAGGGSGGGNDGQDGLSTLFAFKGFASDSDAETDWNINFKNSRNYPPGNVNDGWSTSSNVSLQTGHMLYMTTAQRQGNNYITTNGVIWQHPVRIGSGSDTSHTGTDEDNYNYIYCRTTTNVAPELTGEVGQSSYGVHLLELIEADSNKGNGYKPNSDTPINISSAAVENINEAWTDHPYGVSPQLPFEWQVGFKKNEESGNWEYYFGPVIISHYGHDGLDGDGLEYIFYLQPKNLAGIPSLGAPYDGSVTKNGTTTNYTNVSVNSTDYQLDDFIPTGWHDNPQTISEEYPRQYVSIRKKEGALEANNLWQEFTPPKLWNIYATNGFLATLNNDSIIFDDDSDSDAIEYVSLTKAFLWDGANDVTLSSNYSKVTVTITCVGFSDKLRPGIASINGNDVSVNSGTDWGTPMEINRSNYTGFALTKREGVGKLETKTGSITYTIKAYESGNDTPKIETSRILTILVVDINDGTAYSLQVTPNTLGVSRTNETSPYTLRDAQSITVTATAASGKKVEKVSIKNGSNSVEDNNLYVEVKKSNGDLIDTFLEFPNTKSLVYDLSRVSGILGDNLKYIVVDLYYKYQGEGIKIDSETVDFSVTGDKGPAGQGSGTESYVITTLNDNAVIDDQTTGLQALKIATLNPIKVYKGNDNVTSSCTYTIANENLPQGLAVRTTTDSEFSDYKCYEIYPTASIGVTLTPGNYYYDVVITHEADPVGTKRFKLYIDANISTDGSFYKLSVTNDIVNYNSEGNSLSDSNIVISAYKISLDGTSENVPLFNDPNKLHVVVAPDLACVTNLSNLSGGVITFQRNSTNIPYNANGYDVTLYNGNFYADGPEHIDCIKDGAPGGNGKDSTVYGLEPDPTILKFNVDSENHLTPSSLIARCNISKVEGNTITIHDNAVDGYSMYYNITLSDGTVTNVTDTNYTYISYSNSPGSSGIPVNNSNLTYTAVNFYLAYGSGNKNSLNPIKQISIPILRDGLKGDSSSTGQTGRFYYFAGDWEGDVTSSGLKVTNYSYPYVYYLGSYYMYVGDPSSTDPYIISKANLLGTGKDVTTSDNWKEMTYNKFVVSEAMFANYAKLGAAIFNRDWMISQYGSVNGVPSTNYTSFDPVEFMNAIRGYAEIGVVLGGGLAPLGESGSSYNILSQLFKLPLNNYTITVTLSGSNNSEKEVRLVKFDDVDLFKDVSKVSIITSGNSANATIVADGKCDSNNSNPTILLNGGSGVLTSENAVYCLLAKNSSNVNVSSIKVEITGSYTAFIPNYALDLRSGLTYLNNAYVKGLVSTVNDLVVLKEENLQVGSLGTLNKRGLFCRNDKSNDTSKILASMYTTHYDNDGTTNFNEEGIVELKSNNERYRHHITSRSINLSLYNITDNPGTLIEESIINSSEGKFPKINTKSVSNNSSPVAFPGNIDLGTTVTLPRSSSIPYSGTVIFATNCKEVKILEDVPVFGSDGLGGTYNSNESSIIGTYPANNTHIFDTVSPRIFVGYYVNGNLKWREFMCRQ